MNKCKVSKIKKAFSKKRKIVITQTPIVELEANPNDLPDIKENHSLKKVI